MITVSYKDFISNSGNIQLDKIEDKLRNLFLVDSKIKLKEVDKIYTIDNISDFIRDISLFLINEQKCSEENNQDVKQSVQVEQSIAVEQEDDSEYNVYRTWWGKHLQYLLWYGLYLCSLPMIGELKTFLESIL